MSNKKIQRWIVLAMIITMLVSGIGLSVSALM